MSSQIAGRLLSAVAYLDVMVGLRQVMAVSSDSTCSTGRGLRGSRCDMLTSLSSGRCRAAPRQGEFLLGRYWYYSLLLNWASAAALLGFLRGETQVSWQPRTG